MLGTSSVFTSFSVDKPEAAKKFYVGILGLTQKAGPGPMRLDANGHSIMIYTKPNHEPATFTILNFMVDDVEAKVDELTAKGVTFEQYPEMNTDVKGIHRSEMGAIAWFKDPAGNILSILSM